MKKLFYKLLQIFGIKSAKPVQTVDYTLMAGSVSKKYGPNLESFCNYCRKKTKTKNYDCVKCGFSKPFWRI